MFALSLKLVEIRGEYLQEKETPPLRTMMDPPYTTTTPYMNVLTKASGKHQVSPLPIPTSATGPMLLSQSQPSPGQTHQYYDPHCPAPGPPTAPTPAADPMVKMLPQKMQTHKHKMYLMLLIQATRTTPPRRDPMYQSVITKVGVKRGVWSIQVLIRRVCFTHITVAGR